MKKLKVAQLIGVLILLLGVVIRVSGEIDGTALALIGLLVYTVARIAAWLKSDDA